MRDQGRKPIDFGLKVRAHPDALLVTAQNKMRTSVLIKRVVSIANKSLETTYIKTNENIVNANTVITEKFIRELGAEGIAMETSSLRNPIWRRVPKRFVAGLLRNFAVDPANVKFQAKDLATFVENTSESFLQEWDVVIPQGRGNATTLAGIPVRPTERTVRVYSNSVLVSGKSARIASPGIEQEGLQPEMVNDLIAKYRESEPDKTVPDYVFREKRPRPLLLIHVIKPLPKGNETGVTLPNLLALGLSFRDFDDSDVAKQVEYRINLVELRTADETDEDEDIEAEEFDDELD